MKLDAGEECSLFPLPPGATVLPVSSTGFNLTEIRPNVYHYNDGLYQVLFLYSKVTKHLAVVDFPRFPGVFAPDGTYLPITATMRIIGNDKLSRVSMVYSHRHPDHIGEAVTYKTFVTSQFPNAQLKIYGTAETKSSVSGNTVTVLPLPTVVVGAKPITISVGPDLVLKLIVVGGHTSLNLLSYVPRSKEGGGVVHVIDTIISRSAPFPRFFVTPNLRRYIFALERLMKFDFTYFSTGHGQLGDKQDLKTTLDYTRSVLNTAIAAIEEVQGAGPNDAISIGTGFTDPNDPGFGNTPLLVSRIFNLPTKICVRKIIEEWGCSLGGVDTVVESHCRTAVMFSTIDL